MKPWNTKQVRKPPAPPPIYSPAVKFGSDWIMENNVAKHGETGKSIAFKEFHSEIEQEIIANERFLGAAATNLLLFLHRIYLTTSHLDIVLSSQTIAREMELHYRNISRAMSILVKAGEVIVIGELRTSGVKIRQVARMCEWYDLPVHEGEMNTQEFSGATDSSPFCGQNTYIKPGLARLIRLRASRANKTFDELVSETLLMRLSERHPKKLEKFVA